MDGVAIRKLLGLLTKVSTPAGLGDLQYPALSERAATIARVAALQAAAQLQQAAGAAGGFYAELATQLKPALPALRSCWLAPLRDYLKRVACPL